MSNTPDAFDIIKQVVNQPTLDELLSRAPRRDDIDRVIEICRADRVAWNAKQEAKQAKKEGVDEDE